MEPLNRRKMWAVLLPAMFLPGIAALGYFVWLGDSPLAQVLYGSVKVFTLVWPLIATLFILKRPIRINLKSYKEHLRSVPLGLMVGVPILATIGLLMMTPIGDIVKEAAPMIQKKSDDLGVINHFILFGASISIFHSLIEEYYWRWFVYGNLREVVSIKMAHFLAAFTFTLHHVVVMMQFFELPWALFFSTCVGIGGFFWSLLYQRQKTLIGAWVSHALVDAALMSVGYYMIIY